MSSDGKSQPLTCMRRQSHSCSGMHAATASCGLAAGSPSSSAGCTEVWPAAVLLALACPSRPGQPVRACSRGDGWAAVRWASPRGQRTAQRRGGPAPSPHALCTHRWLGQPPEPRFPEPTRHGVVVAVAVAVAIPGIPSALRAAAPSLGGGQRRRRRRQAVTVAVAAPQAPTTLVGAHLTLAWAARRVSSGCGAPPSIAVELLSPAAQVPCEPPAHPAVQ